MPKSPALGSDAGAAAADATEDEEQIWKSPPPLILGSVGRDQIVAHNSLR